MPDTVFDTLESSYKEIVRAMPDRVFDSHQFILLLAQRCQQDYVKALAAYVHTTRPFQIVHGEIARRLQNHPTLLRKVGEHDSRDIFGQFNSAVLWEKVG
jgi:hypothetical protein